MFQENPKKLARGKNQENVKKVTGGHGASKNSSRW
jgi:hypothetical protein